MDPAQSASTRAPESRIPFFRSMHGSLLAWFVLLAILPMLLVSVMFANRAQNALMQEAADKLVAVRELKEDLLKTLFRKWEAEILLWPNWRP